MHKDVDFDKSVLNLELGAGIGTFGKVFFPKCYSTDSNSQQYKNIDNHIDIYCEAEDLPFEDNRFEWVIMCSPWGYGFDSKENALSLLKEVSRVLKDNGKILIIANHTNKYVARLEKRVNELHLDGVTITIAESINIDYKTKYSCHLFFTTDFDHTKPDKQFILHVSKA
jgi:SAM-dependent methyltransferase